MYVVFGHKGASFNIGELFSNNCCNVCLVTRREICRWVNEVWQWSSPCLGFGFRLSVDEVVDSVVELFLFFVSVVLVGSVGQVLKVGVFVLFNLGFESFGK